jgi:hypothetical protein
VLQPWTCSVTVSATTIGATGSVNAVCSVRLSVVGVCATVRSDAIETDSPSTTRRRDASAHLRRGPGQVLVVGGGTSSVW